MGMRVDLVDKEKYQVNSKQQRSMLLGTSSSSSAMKGNIKSEQEFTEKMLEDLRVKLLSSRDRFILSSKDTLPELDLGLKKLAPGMVKLGSIDDRHISIKDENGVLAENGSR